MSRAESDREDLLREATALVLRAELLVAGQPEPVVAGFRRGGSASFYFGADPVYQFNAAGELRRAYVAGRLLKAEQGNLVALNRERTSGALELVRTELSPAEQAELLQRAQSRLRSLETALAAGEFELLGQVPAEEDVVARLGKWLQDRPDEIAVARLPNVR
jgi:hypothetical protein